MAADSIGIRPTLPPNSPGGFDAGVATGRTSVSVSELAGPGSGASEVAAEATAEVSDTGAPTMGTAEGVFVSAAGGGWEEGRGASVVEEGAPESPGGVTRPG
jgi:hypothetical protein